VSVGVLDYDTVKAHFPIAASSAWGIAYNKLTALYPLIDPK